MGAGDIRIEDRRRSAEEIYGDIINLPHPESVRHKRMSELDRAAQFAPFAALTGYEDAVDETGRLTRDRIEIDEERKREIDRKLQILMSVNINSNYTTIIYYKPDKYKSGGEYVSCSADVKKYNQENRTLIMRDGTIIPVEDIFDIR